MAAAATAAGRDAASRAEREMRPDRSQQQHERHCEDRDRCRQRQEDPHSSRSVCALLEPAFDRQVGRHLYAQCPGGALESELESRQVERQQIVQADDSGLSEKRLLCVAEIGQVEQECLVAPVVDVVGRGADLVGQVLTSGVCLRDFEQQARGEYALALERFEVDSPGRAAGSRSAACR